MTSLPKSLQRIARACALVLVVSVLGACGFHLRNALAIPPDLGPLRVVSPYQYSPLATALSEALDRAGAVPAAPGATTGVATLRILSERWGNTALSVDQRGRAQEFTLRYAVVFRMTRADQHTSFDSTHSNASTPAAVPSCKESVCGRPALHLIKASRTATRRESSAPVVSRFMAATNASRAAGNVRDMVVAGGG